MKIDVAISKINQAGQAESGETIEVVERPNGGLSIVMAEVLTPARDKKAISAAIVRKVLTWIGDGIRDGAAARAASDFLYTEHKGQLSACLNILSFDKQSDTIVLTRNNPTPIYIYQEGELNCLSGQSYCIGNSLSIRPLISEIPLTVNTMLVLYSSGVAKAGESTGQQIDMCTLIHSMMDEQEPDAQAIAETLLNESIRVDQNRPKADMAILVASINQYHDSQIRKMTVQYPLPEKMDDSSFL